MAGIEAIASRPEALILFVEGDGCAALGNIVLGDYICIDWADIEKCIDEVSGRDVQLWPLAAASIVANAPKLLKVCRSVSIIDTKNDPPGTRLDTILQERMSGDGVIDFMRTRVRPLMAEKKKKPNGAVTHESDPDRPADKGFGSALSAWQSLALDCNSNGYPHSTLGNISAIIQGHPQLAGKIWFDRFRSKIFHEFKSMPQEWADADTRDLTVWLNQQMKLHKVSVGMTHDAVLHAAYRFQRNSLTAWLGSLEWDGTARLSTWLSDTLGVARSPYTDAVAQNWLISMVARAYSPGCQADNMPVLEGRMGSGKSSFLRLLGGEWYSALPDAFGSKDFLQGIVGQWLIEVPDLAGFGRREHQHILATITTPTDRYRASYGRATEDHPRTCIFTATSETDEYLQDARGRRRFWPLRCESIDLDALSAQRAQLFAEAVRAFKGGSLWHEVPQAEADEQQLERVDEDAWSRQVWEYVNGKMIDHFGQAVVPDLTSTGILSAVGVPLKDQHDGMKRRVKGIMLHRGWSQKVVWDQGRTVRKWFKK
jgi:putative DNA primase/helicase